MGLKYIALLLYADYNLGGIAQGVIMMYIFLVIFLCSPKKKYLDCPKDLYECIIRLGRIADCDYQ